MSLLLGAWSFVDLHLLQSFLSLVILLLFFSLIDRPHDFLSRRCMDVQIRQALLKQSSELFCAKVPSTEPDDVLNLCFYLSLSNLVIQACEQLLMRSVNQLHVVRIQEVAQIGIFIDRHCECRHHLVQQTKEVWEDSLQILAVYAVVWQVLISGVHFTEHVKHESLYLGTLHRLEMEDAVVELREDVRALVRERVERHHAVVDEDYGEDLRHEIGLAN